MSNSFEKIQRPSTSGEVYALAIAGDLMELNNKFGIQLENDDLIILRKLHDSVEEYLNVLTSQLEEIKKD